jgi:hypothetical protein
MDDDPKLCTACRCCGGEQTPLCMHDHARVLRPAYLATGIGMKYTFYFCEVMRAVGSACGPEARLFQPSDTQPVQPPADESTCSA